MARSVVVFLAFANLTGVSLARTWTDSTGRFSVEAELVEIKDGKVHLRKAGGTQIAVSIARLSQDDRSYVTARQRPLLRTWTNRADGTSFLASFQSCSGQQVTLHTFRGKAIRVELGGLRSSEANLILNGHAGRDPRDRLIVALDVMVPFHHRWVAFARYAAAGWIAIDICGDGVDIRVIDDVVGHDVKIRRRRVAG